MKLKENKFLLYGVCVVLVAALVLIAVLNIPSKKVIRVLNRAQKQYEAMDYEKAEKNYIKVLKIDRVNVEAAKGYVLCNMNESETAAAEAFKSVTTALYDEAKVQGNDSFIEEDRTGWIDFFLLAPEFSEGSATYHYVKDGYDKLSGPSELKPALADACITWGVELYETALKENNPEILENAMDIFAECLEYSDNGATYCETMFPYVNDRVWSLTDKGDFEAAYGLAESFKAVYADGYDTQIQKINEAEKFFNLKKNLLSKVYEAMKPYFENNREADLSEVFNAENPVVGMLGANWDSMLLLDGSEDADTLAASQYAEQYLYSPEGFDRAATKIGCGLYPYGEMYTKEDGSQGAGYYFYFGEYENGQRNGYGIAFAKSGSTSFVGYEGQWKEDKPCGTGIQYECNMYAHTSLAEYRRATYGNFSEGLQDGEMTTRAVLNEHPDTSFMGTYVVSKGVAAALEGEPLDYGIVDATPEGYLLVAIIPSVDAGYDYFIPVYEKKDSTMSVIGY